MSVVMDGVVAIFSPPSDRKGLFVAIGEQGASNTFSQILWNPLWQAFEVDQVMNNPPSGTICNGNVYVVYPSTQMDTPYAFCYTCVGTSWSGPTEVRGVTTNVGLGAVTYKGSPYAFYQGTNINLHNSGMMFVANLPTGSVWDVRSGEVIMSNIPSAVEFNDEVYVFYQGPGNDEQLYFTHASSIGSGNWVQSTPVANTQIASSGSPGVVLFNGLAYVFYPSPNDAICYRTLSTSGDWGAQGSVPAAQMTGKPSPMAYNGILYVFYEGSGGGTMWYVSSSDAVDWSVPVQVAMTGISASPSLVVYDSKLCCFMQGPGNDNQLWNTFVVPGSTSSFMTRINGEIMSWSPAAVVYNEQVYVFLQGEGESGAMYYCIGDANGWQPSIKVLSEGEMTGSPGPVVYNEVLYVFSQGGDYAGNLRYNTYSSSGGWNSTPTVVPGAGMSGWPAPVVWNEDLYVFYEGKGNANGLWYSVMSIDGSWSGSRQVNTNGVSYSNQTGSDHGGTTAPCTVVFGGNLYVGYLGDGGMMYINGFSSDGSSTGSPCNILDTTTVSCAFSMAVLDDVLYLVYQESTTGKLWYMTNSGNPCDRTQWSEGIELGAEPSTSPPGAISSWTDNVISCLQMF